MWRHLLFLNASEFDYLSCDPTTTMIFVNKTQEKLFPTQPEMKGQKFLNEFCHSSSYIIKIMY